MAPFNFGFLLSFARPSIFTQRAQRVRNGRHGTTIDFASVAYPWRPLRETPLFKLQFQTQSAKLIHQYVE